LFSFIQLSCFAQVGGGGDVLNQLGFVHAALAKGWTGKYFRAAMSALRQVVSRNFWVTGLKSRVRK
jgi:hypothetical protein